MKCCKKNFRLFLYFTCLFTFFFFYRTEPLYAVGVDSKNEDEISMIKGDVESVKVFELERVSLTRPEIADLSSIDANRIVIVAKQSGQTTLIIWDKYGKRSLTIRVADDDLASVKERIQQLLADANIKGITLDVNPLESKIILSGELTKETKVSFDKLVEPFNANIMNLVKEKATDDLIQIDAQISELNSNFSKSMGIEWTPALTYAETLPTFGKYDYLKIGDFARTTQILATVNAFITEGKGRVLSKPKLVCTSGKEANILVGGQVPITQTTTSSGGTITQDVTFHDYGVTMKINPSLREDKIDIVLNISISDIDPTNKSNGNVAFTTRSASTQLYLNNGQTVILGGLIKHNEAKSYKRIPLLSDIPILGAAFRHAEPSNTDTEIIISLTPTILSDGKIMPSRKSYPVITNSPNQAGEKMTLPPSTSGVASTSYVANDAMTTKAYISEEMVPYVQKIQQQIAGHIAYPEEAKKYGWEGTVKLALNILSDGTLAQATVKESSGYELFDDDALNTAKSLAPYANFPSNLNRQELAITVPIVYSLNQDTSH